MPEGGGIQGFISKDTAGLPNWAWLLVVAGGIAAAYFVPKFLGGQSTSATDQGATNAGTAQSNTNGIGLAVDPTTGLPYAVEGLSPSGGLAGGGGAGGVDLSGITTALNSILANLNKTTPPPTPTPVTGKGKGGCPTGQTMCNGKCQPAGLLCRDQTPPPERRPSRITQKQEQKINAAAEARTDLRVTPRRVRGDMLPANYHTVASWPFSGQSLGDVARMHGVTERRLALLNPQIEQPHNLQPGQKVRIA